MLIFRMGQEACCNWFALKGGQYLIYASLQTHRRLDYTSWKTQHLWCSVDAHFQDGAGSVSLLFLASMAATTLFLHVSKQLSVTLPWSNSKNHRQSIDAHFWAGTGRVLVILLLQKAVNTSFMTGWIQSPFRLHNIHSQQSLTLHGHSFSERGSHCVV